MIASQAGDVDGALHVGPLGEFGATSHASARSCRGVQDGRETPSCEEGRQAGFVLGVDRDDFRSDQSPRLRGRRPIT